MTEQSVCLVCGLPVSHLGEHETTDICCEELMEVNKALLEALKRLERAYTADAERCPQLDIKTAYETNSQAHAQARAAIAKAIGTP